jgi:ribosome-binding protein aMBF1 (putative translation factor)
MDELAQPIATQRPGRYVVVEGEDGRRRVARADGLPLGTPFVRTTPRPERRVTARGFLAALRTRPTTQRGGRPTTQTLTEAPGAPTGEAIKRRREACGLSQRDLAAATGLSRGLLSEIESGTRDAAESRRAFGNALTLRERNRPAAPLAGDGLPRAGAG